MPTRQFSAAILTGSWPQTDPASCASLSEIHRGKAIELLDCASRSRNVSDEIISTQSGASVDAFRTTSYALAATFTSQADLYFAMSRASAECGRILSGLREDLNQIDAQAHRQIDQIMRTAVGPAAAIARAEAVQVIVAARTEAVAASTQAVTRIADQGTAIGITPAKKPGNPHTGVQEASFGIGIKDAPPPTPPVNPFPGWSDERKKQVAAEIAHGHAWPDHGDEFPGWTQKDLARWIYDTMNDPTTRVGTSTKSGGVALLRQGKVVFVNPADGDYGTAFVPKPLAGSQWRTPEEYFDQNTTAATSLAPPGAGRLPPVDPSEMAPPTSVPTPPSPPQIGGATPPAAAPTAPLPGGTLPGWGTHISPDQIDPNAGDEIANLEKFLRAFRPGPPPTA